MHAFIKSSFKNLYFACIEFLVVPNLNNGVYISVETNVIKVQNVTHGIPMLVDKILVSKQEIVIRTIKSQTKTQCLFDEVCDILPQ